MMNNEIAPKVSVVMGVYNDQKYVSRAIESILNQTYQNFEFIIINDGSTDKTKNILESFTDKRIRLFHQKNIGLTKTLNKGIDIARGEYIARQDADDISHELRLKRQVEVLDRKHDIVLVGTHCSYIDQNGKSFAVWRTPQRYDDILMALKKSNCFCHGSVMFRKSCLEKSGKYNEFFVYTQDYELWCRIAERFQVTNIPEVLYELRKESGTISRKKLSKQLEYHLLTNLMSDDRLQKNRKGTNHFSETNPLRVLKLDYGLSNMEINRFKSDHYMIYFNDALKMKEYLYASSLWIKSFLMFPCKAYLKTLIYSVYNIANSLRNK